MYVFVAWWTHLMDYIWYFQMIKNDLIQVEMSRWEHDWSGIR